MDFRFDAGGDGAVGAATRGARAPGEKDDKLAQKLGQLQPFYSCVPTGVHGPTCILWANLTPFSTQLLDALDTAVYLLPAAARDVLNVEFWAEEAGGGSAKQSWARTPAKSAQVRKTPSWPRSWANSSLL